MSSGDDDFNEGESSSQAQKKRRIQRACDICRRKKIRCDGVQMPGNRCSNCIAYTYSCTYIEAAKKRGPPKGYVESLENRVERLEKLLKRLCPDEALYKELTANIENWTADHPPTDPSPIVGTAAEVQPPKLPPGVITPLESLSSALRGMSNTTQTPQDITDDDEDSSLLLVDNMKRLQLDPHEYRFFGKSSGAMLIRTAIELKNEYAGRETVTSVLRNKRKEFWTVRPWEKEPEFMETPVYNFPEPDLAEHVVDCYFANVNLYLPLLHRPTFDKMVQEGLHHRDSTFAGVFLLVCAVGARYSSDNRVKLEGSDSLHSSGWKWFEQVQMVKKSLLSPPTLFDLQTYCLSVQFLQGTSAPQSCWTMVGIGIRLAQDVGAHRRKVPSHIMTAEDELWKRAFWVLVCMDRMVSSSLGRPCAIQDEDFDLDLPVDCDDEYWDNEDPEQRFKQPPNKPSLVTAFNLYLKLHQILAFSLRTIYSINKSKILLGFVGQQWEQHIVAELDSALNKWVDSVPDFLRWDPNREDDNFFNQSVTLYAAYYHIQILIHRPFIPSPSKPSPLSFPSLAICTNAARSCSHVVYIQKKRNATTIPQIQMSVFTSGIVLLLSIWGGKRSGLSIDPNKEMEDVHKCMEVLRKSEDRWHSAGRLWDILYELASVGDLPLPQSSPNGTNKRERDSETPISSNPSEVSLTSLAHDGPRNIAGSRRVNKDHSSSAAAAAASRRLSQPQSQGMHGEMAHIPSSSPTTTMHGHSHTSMRRPSSHSHLQAQAQAQQQHQMQDATMMSTPSSSSGLPTPSQTTPVECFALPVYSNELGRIPLHGGVTFSAQAQNHQQQQHQNYWYGGDKQANMNVGGQPMMGGHQRAQPGFSLGEMSTMTQQGGYDMDAASMAAGMMFDTMAGTLAYGHPHHQHHHQQPGNYGMDGGGGARVGGGGGGGSGSGMDIPAVPIPPLNLPSMGDTYRGMDGSGRGGDGRGGIHMLGSQQQQQHQQHPMQMGGTGPLGVPQGQPQQPQPQHYQFVDSDTIAMWSNAPSGFELDEWGTYLTNVSELTHGGHGHSGNGMQNHHRS